MTEDEDNIDDLASDIGFYWTADDFGALIELTLHYIMSCRSNECKQFIKEIQTAIENHLNYPYEL